MSSIVGIDLGTTNSLVAVIEAGIPCVLADGDGRRLTPSVVRFPSGGGEPEVGFRALRARVLHPRETAYSVKRFMGRRWGEVSEEERGVNYGLGRGPEGGVGIELGGRILSPEEVSSEVLRKLRADAERAMGSPVDRAVITVPAYFNDAQRAATKRAGELAGFKVERIVNEPTAAALAYGLNRLKERSKVAVYDLGGGTFDLSILELNDGVFQVLATSGNTRLGGDDLDRRVAGFLSKAILEAGGPDVSADPALTARVREAAEDAKIRLSTEEAVDVSLPFLSAAFSFSLRFERSALEELTRDLVVATRVHCLRALADAKLTSADLDQVILVGGQTRMPLVRRLVSEWFGCVDEDAANVASASHAGPRLNTSQNPDEAVALGAAIQAEILSGGFSHLLLLDVTPLSLGIETFGGLMNVIIPRNSTIPIKAGEMFTTAVDMQRSMLIHVLQGERERAADNWSLGRFTLEFEPAPKGVPRVGVQFEIDANGILHVLARDIRTGRDTVVRVKSAVDVEDSAVQKMVEESVEHAFDDMRARQWIEAKLKAGETIVATRKGLSDAAAEIEEDYRREIEAALGNVEAALSTEDKATRTGDVGRLKSANAALDQTTGRLAELLMDKAMEALLRQQGLIS